MANKFSDYLKTNYPDSWLLKFRNTSSEEMDEICDECMKHNFKLKETKLCKDCKHVSNN